MMDHPGIRDYELEALYDRVAALEVEATEINRLRTELRGAVSMMALIVQAVGGEISIPYSALLGDIPTLCRWDDVGTRAVRYTVLNTFESEANK